jgi:hypothetical protein
VGGAQELAFKLKVTPSHLSLWMGGLEPCPGYVFLKAVDLVLEREIASQTSSHTTPLDPEPEADPDPDDDSAPRGSAPSIR